MPSKQILRIATYDNAVQSAENYACSYDDREIDIL